MCVSNPVVLVPTIPTVLEFRFDQVGDFGTRPHHNTFRQNGSCSFFVKYRVLAVNAGFHSVFPIYSGTGRDQLIE